MLHRSILFFIVFIGLHASANAAPFIVYADQESAETATLNVGDIASYKAFCLDNPDRLVVDLPIVALPKISQSNNSDIIKNVRAGWFNPETARIVFELEVGCNLLDKSLDDGKLSLTLGANKKSSKKFKSEKSAKEEKPTKPEKPMIVIDPGHGGDDPGAIGQKGSQEKDIVLTFAKALEESLLKTGRYRVKLTRDSDKFIPLRERVAIARKAGGTIFISIHADSAPGDDARGLSLYTLSDKASDTQAAALAAQENKADIIGGMDLSHEREDVADILISLAQRDTKNQSALLADTLVISLEKRLRVLNNTHRYAGFAVLKAPDIPSVLVETGFISHPQEEKLLKTKDYRQKLMAGLVEGIDKYFAKRGNSAP